MKRLRAALLIPVMLPLLLSDCASPYARFDDAGDACHAARAPLLGMGDDFQSTMLGATAIGTGVGALSGAVIGQSWKDVLIGAAAGAMAGALTGYLKAKYDRAHTRGEVLGLIDQDAAHDTAELRQSSNAITALIDCRSGQTRAIETEYAARRITREQALASYRDVQSRTKQDDELIQSLLGAADKRAENYVGARAQVLSLPDPARANSPATAQLLASRQDAADKQARYAQFRDGLDRRLAALEHAV